MSVVAAVSKCGKLSASGWPGLEWHFGLEKGFRELYLSRAYHHSLGISRMSWNILTLLVLERCKVILRGRLLLLPPPSGKGHSIQLILEEPFMWSDLSQIPPV